MPARLASPRIAFYTTAGYSAGHHQCLANIARAVVDRDPNACIHLVQPEVYGGVRFRPTDDLPQCTTVELPSATPGRLNPNEVPTAEEERGRHEPGSEVAARRRRVLEQALAGLAFDVLVIESFPFLTQQEKGEVEHLLAVVRGSSPHVRILASVRDVLFGRRADVFDPQTRRYAEEFVLRETDKLLVHADPSVTPFEASYGDASGLATHLVYTGVIGRRTGPQGPRGPRGSHVVCSLGGGRKWRIPTVAFVEAWGRLAQANRLPIDTHGYVFCGLEGPEEELLQLLEDYARRSESERFPLSLGAWEDFTEFAATAACSVSMCGYNTAYELLAWRTPAVFSPREHNGPGPHPLGEQGLRAQILADKGWAAVAPSPEGMADEIEQRVRAPRSVDLKMDFRGAETTARILLETAAS